MSVPGNLQKDQKSVEKSSPTSSQAKHILCFQSTWFIKAKRGRRLEQSASPTTNHHQLLQLFARWQLQLCFMRNMSQRWNSLSIFKKSFSIDKCNSSDLVFGRSVCQEKSDLQLIYGGFSVQFMRILLQLYDCIYIVSTDTHASFKDTNPLFMTCAWIRLQVTAEYSEIAGSGFPRSSISLFVHVVSFQLRSFRCEFTRSFDEEQNETQVFLSFPSLVWLLKKQLLFVPRPMAPVQKFELHGPKNCELTRREVRETRGFKFVPCWRNAHFPNIQCALTQANNYNLQPIYFSLFTPKYGDSGGLGLSWVLVFALLLSFVLVFPWVLFLYWTGDRGKYLDPTGCLLPQIYRTKDIALQSTELTLGRVLAKRTPDACARSMPSLEVIFVSCTLQAQHKSPENKTKF